MDYNNEKKSKTDNATGLVGVRQTLKDMGFSDSEIGYDNASGTVTLKGKSLLTPSYLDKDAGVSYAKASDIQKSVVNYYQNSSNPVVRVSDAYASEAGPYGLSADAMNYGNGTVSVGGKPLQVLYIDDEGKAWARQNTVKSAVKNYVDSVGVQTPEALANAYAKKYLSGVQTLLNGIKNREEFSYDPDSDPVYQAYRTKYRLEGERAGKDAMANLAGLTGGYSNSAAVTAGAQAEQYYAQKLTDTIPELAQQAYERYVKKYQTDLDLAGQMVNLYDTAYKNAASADATQREYINDVASSNVERDETAWEKAWKELQNQQDYAMSQQSIIKSILDNQDAEVYQRYYEQLLQAELQKKQLENQIKGKKL